MLFIAMAAVTPKRISRSSRGPSARLCAGPVR